MEYFSTLTPTGDVDGRAFNIKTSAGTVTIEDKDDGTVTIIVASDCDSQHVLPLGESYRDTSISHTFRTTAKPPAIGDEVTMDGTTFEVSARKYVGKGAWMLTSDTDGQMHRWQG